MDLFDRTKFKQSQSTLHPTRWLVEKGITGLLILQVLYCLVISEPAGAYPFHLLQQGLLAQPVPKTFISTWNTLATSSGSSNANQIRLPLVASGAYDFQVDWGDGTVSHIRSYDDPLATHTYAIAGSYTLTIGGTVVGWAFANGGDRLKITQISQWGSLRLGN